MFYYGHGNSLITCYEEYVTERLIGTDVPEHVAFEASKEEVEQAIKEEGLDPKVVMQELSGIAEESEEEEDNSESEESGSEGETEA